MNLKKRDKRLLYEFCRNSRRPYTVLARKARMSQQLAAYKIRAMRESGLIALSYPLIDYSRFGLLKFSVHFRVNYRSEQAFRDLVARLSKHEDVVGVDERDGKYDLIVSFAARNPSAFNKTLRHLIEKNPDQLKEHMILTSVVSHYFPRKYLVGLESSTRDTVIGGDREVLVLSDVDKKVLELLQGNARARTVDIASKTGINPRTAVSAIKRLQKLGILRGFSAILDPRESDLIQGMMLLRYQNLSLEQEDELRNFCITSRHVTEMHKLFGNYDVAIVIEAENARQLRSVYIQTRERFENIINDSDSFRLFRTHRLSFLPKSFFA